MTTSGFGRMGIGMLDAEILIEPYVPILSPLCLKMPKLTCWNVQSNIDMNLVCTKGQLILKCHFSVFKSSKKTNELFSRISDLASKKRSNQENKDTLFH